MRLTSTRAGRRQPRTGSARLQACVVAALLCSGASTCWAQAKPVAGIYSCIDDKGRRLTSDRPIPECSSREQQVLNKDGSLRTVQPPTLTAEERAEKEARERKAIEARNAQADIVRRDKNLLLRHPNEASHRKAREAALDTVRLAIKGSEQRLKDLEKERKPLLDEAEFYKGRQLPFKLRMALEANDVATEAQRAATVNQEAEVGRVNQIYDIELARLKKLWAGAAPGSMGPLPNPATAGAKAAAPAASPASSASTTR